MSFNRYQHLTKNGVVLKMPNIVLAEKATDFYITYKRGQSRLDNISYDYYGDANYDWLILLANQEIAGLEFEIPDNTVIRIPYPLSATLEEFTNKLETYNVLYGLE